MTKPDFLIGGVEKGGTSSLRYHLSQHPQIYMPIMEPRFFLENQKISKSKYKTLFRDCTEKVVGEKTPSYFTSEESARMIFKWNDEMKLIFLLREPVSRAYSSYRMAYNKKAIDGSFGNYLIKDKGAINKGLYLIHINRFRKYFPDKNIHLILSERYRVEKEQVLKEVFEFLDVPNIIPEDLSDKNIGIKTTGLSRTISKMHDKYIGNTNSRLLKTISETGRNILKEPRTEFDKEEYSWLYSQYEYYNKSLKQFGLDIDKWWK